MIGEKEIISFASPQRGVVRVSAREEQPEGTCWNALNILPYDRFGRGRVSQRPGTGKQWPSAIGGGTVIQGMLATNFIVYPAQAGAGITYGTTPFIGADTGIITGHATVTPAGLVTLISTGDSWTSNVPSTGSLGSTYTVAFDISTSNVNNHVQVNCGGTYANFASNAGQWSVSFGGQTTPYGLAVNELFAISLTIHAGLPGTLTFDLGGSLVSTYSIDLFSTNQYGFGISSISESGSTFFE